MVLQARNKHREAAPKPPQPPRASQSPLRGSPEVGAGEPGPERVLLSPGRKGTAGRKGARAESATPPGGGGLGGRLAAGLRGARPDLDHVPASCLCSGVALEPYNTSLKMTVIFLTSQPWKGRWHFALKWATKLHRGSLIALCISNIFFMLPWQFAQFVLLTQIASLFAVYVVGFINICKLQKIIYMHMISLALCFVLMFGNSMLLTSYYASSLGVLALKPHLLKINVSEPSLWAHIGNLLTSKFFSYKDFDTLLYTCAEEFDFMEKEKAPV